MRIIDADELIYMEFGGIEFVPTEFIKDAPTIDAVPVVHAKMMRTDAYPHRIYCGNCYKTLIQNEEYCFEKNEFPKFCMWCGAKMDGDISEEEKNE